MGRFSAKYPAAMKELEKDQEELLVFYDFPSEHWASIRTRNLIKLAFMTVRLTRIRRLKNYGLKNNPFNAI
ncbi:MAG: transposase [Arsenophonus sp. NEOnobi-MAG3]